jgi:diaminopimelate epimerase
MNINFTKMHGLGNDFMVIDAISQHIKITGQQIIVWSNRYTGIGFDQCLLIERSNQAGIDFYYRIFNANGHEVGQCGNGARCLGRFVVHYGLTNKQEIIVATQTTRMHLYINANNQMVTVNMGVPCWQPDYIPLLAKQAAICYEVLLPDGDKCMVHAVGLGNPHAVVIVDNLAVIPVSQLGKLISEHALFPQQANVSFVQIINEHHIKLRVYERDCGETLACGSAAVAAVAVGRKFYNLVECVEVCLPGGVLTVQWPNQQAAILLTGPAIFVYEGSVDIAQ